MYFRKRKNLGQPQTPLPPRTLQQTPNVT